MTDFVGAGGGTWTPTSKGQQILSLQRLPFRHARTILAYFLNGGRYWDWTSDPLRVEQVLYRWANRPLFAVSFCLVP